MEPEGTVLGSRRWLNVAALTLALGLMLSYRLWRRRMRSSRRERKEAGLVVGFDVDGVLANQVHDIVIRLKRRGIELSYDDITDWRLPLGDDNDIAKEIEGAMTDPDYVLGMPQHEGARDAVNRLYEDNVIHIITARPPEAEGWSRQWLENAGIRFDSLVSIKDRPKSFFATDVLVDDYLGNVRPFLEETAGIAMLVDQPWNRDRTEVDQWIREGRLRIVQNLHGIGGIIAEVRASRTEAED